jgi:SAM-dependent methyltransferase
VELAKRGFAMTGIDISKGMLDQAGLACARAGVSVELVRADAVDFQLPAVYDAALCLCEGSFGLLSAGDDPFDRDIRILRNIQSALKPGGRLLMTVLNGLRMARKYTDKDVVEGRFDPLSLSETYPLTNLLPDASKDVTMREKGFTAGELVLMLKAAGFADISIGGGTAGNWGRRAPELDEFELMVFAAKS